VDAPHIVEWIVSLRVSLDAVALLNFPIDRLTSASNSATGFDVTIGGRMIL
jgi:hypothetical protein